MAGWTTLVQAETLAVALGRPDLVVLDCRFSLLDPNVGEQAYLRSHLPGAAYAHLERDLSDMGPHGEGRHPWPQAEVLVAKLRSWGIDAHSQVIAYDDGDGAYAARLWFLLRLLGHEKVAVLDGGWARWTAMGLPVASSPFQRPPSRYEAADFDRSRLLDADQVESHLFESGLLVDARAPARFRGEEEPIDRVAGHVPGAINRPFASNLTDGRFKSPMQLADEFRALLGGRDPAATVLMCGSGVTACHNILAMERAGLKGAKLFTGSWSGWIQDPSRPVATGP
ncbi:sulfurtransferase [Thermomonas carbonis]|uniref:Sulfurtransferase n=1 Tax=Thermomonas carbonis TaxID=1463158 RepID=A0A7G9SQB4_9GAMM|nr:sulfurtransferase [Thermomonas carbonis]QNN70039.1 sulfurtransferase [Thermomonas carbonis]GHB97290.1 thiosulfate sulfurtransferase [Thermomonas carbonis]